MLIRAQEMARYVEDGSARRRINWPRLGGRKRSERSNGSRSCVCQAELRQGALGSRGPGESLFSRASKDLEGKTIATELVSTTKRYLASRGMKAKVEFSWGATEVKPPELADAIVEVTETGSSLRANKLRIIETVLESNTQLIANQSGLVGPAGNGASWKTCKLLLEGAMSALGEGGADDERAASPSADPPQCTPGAEESRRFLSSATNPGWR